MGKIGIFTNESKDKNMEITKLLISKLQDRGAFVMLPEKKAELAGRQDLGISEEEFFKRADIVVSLGGDGTFLNVARKVCMYDTPILGVNVGNLGFLAEVNKNDLDDVVDVLVTGNYRIKNRMLLEARVKSEGHESEAYYALNDVVVSRGTISRVINITTLLDGHVINKFPADGIIISTATGSTAYSLSAGGPIIEPGMNLMVITPICPHILHSRSVVVAARKQITIMIEDKNKNDAMLTVDGQETLTLTNKHSVTIKKSDYSIKVIRLYEKRFFDTVKSKLFERNSRGE